MTDQAHTLYRFYNADGDLLYVGISLSFLRRALVHADKSWWPEVTTARLEHYANRSEAHEAEKNAIRDERPTHNVLHLPERPPRQPRERVDPGMSVVSIRVPRSIHEKFLLQATSQDRSFSAQLRVVMAQHVAEQDLEEAA